MGPTAVAVSGIGTGECGNRLRNKTRLSIDRYQAGRFLVRLCIALGQGLHLPATKQRKIHVRHFSGHRHSGFMPLGL